MNFANVYRESFSRFIEDETKKIYTEDQDNTVYGLLIDAIKDVRTKNGISPENITEKPLSLNDNDQELVEIIEK